MSRVAWVVGPVLALLGLVSCGSSGSKNGTGGLGKCSPTGTGNGTCTTAEINVYSTCINNACGAQYNTCFTGACAATLQCQDKCACGDTSCLIACGIPTAACTTCLASVATCTASCTVPACYSGDGLGGTSGAGTGGAGGFSGGSGGASGGPGGATGTGQACQDLLACCNLSTQKASCLEAYSATVAQGESSCVAGAGVFKLLYCPSTNGATCKDLLACCNRAAADFKPSCMAIYDGAVANGDETCGGQLQLIMSTLCP